ncbi:MAG: DUF3147 family protein [Acidobacteriaceae bacterium]|nr:DUF3147 family protein [Acidobacteriaceae bacterium]
MKELLFRFVAGGVLVSLFAFLGDIFRPKSFAGLFGAAPSVALATLALTIIADGKEYAASEARSMVAGAIAFLIYASVTSRILMRYKPHALTATLALMPVWLGVAFGVWLVWLR